MSQFKITIPEPCHEDWNVMTPTDQGRFCQTCSKEVIDFTTRSNEEVIKHLLKTPSGCARFLPQQLNTSIAPISTVKRKWRLLPLAGALFLGLGTNTLVHAQDKPKTEVTPKLYTSIPLAQTQQQQITVNGIIIDENDMALPGATILIKDTATGTSTDFDGKFSLECTNNALLIISYIGYDDIEIMAHAVNSNPIKMILDPASIEFTFITGGYLGHKKRWIGGRLWIRFTNLFRKEKKNPWIRI